MTPRPRPHVDATRSEWRHAPDPPPFIGVEEPENFLHPRLLPELAEECRAASDHSQLLVTTHSPFFLNAVRPEEVRVLYRDERGHTQAVRAADIRGVPEFMDAGALLGQLWMEGHFGVGDPLVNQGAPTRPAGGRRLFIPKAFDGCHHDKLQKKFVIPAKAGSGGARLRTA